MKTTLDIRALPKAALTLLLTVVALCAIDYAVRQWNPITTPRFWGNVMLELKLNMLEKLYKKYGRIDVLVFGSSVGLGVDTGLWQRASNNELICFNMCVDSMPSKIINFLFCKYLYQKYHPKCVLYCDFPQMVFPVNGKYSSRAAMSSFWTAPKVKDLLTTNTCQRTLNTLNDLSYVSIAKHHLRAAITKGAKTGGFLQPTAKVSDDFGVTPSVNWYQGPRHHEVKDNRMFSREWFDYTVQLFQFCKEHNIDFYYVNMDMSTLEWDTYPEGAKQQYVEEFTKAYPPDHLVDLDSVIDTQPKDFVDCVHRNILGYSKVNQYLYNKIMLPKLKNSQSAISNQTVYSFAHTSTTLGDNCSVVSVPSSLPLQISIEKPETSAVLAQIFAPGSYECVLIGKEISKDAVARVTIAAIDSKGNVLDSQKLPISHARCRGGEATHTIANLKFDVPARIAVTVNTLAPNSNVLLDSVIIQQMNLPETHVQTSPPVRAVTAIPSNVSFVQNGSFSIPPDKGSTTTVAQSWRIRNNTYAKIHSLSDGNRVLMISGNNSKLNISQPVSQPITSQLPNKIVKLSFVAKVTSGTVLSGKVNASFAKNAHEPLQFVAMPPEGASLQQWCEYTSAFSLPQNSISNMEISFSLPKSTPEGYALIDDVRLEVVNE
ncbi:MAG: hypothetical protein PHX74_12720 [Candidatus Sumerlaeales bacterium]|nr:hypothetical protein [Candidatus Sumerlaeales bacterium]